ncbi:MAG: hypothetical protein UZ21_OP11001000998 [Microgenomates bacterium OLB22]|nr:MAG: hypothetical protein UZ21_OP11001000998 [Microgenomates bacterium OLB22]
MKRQTLILIGILLITIFTRVVGLNWDSGAHLHPDERFLTMVVSSMKMPLSVQEYLDPSISPMNPTNLHFPFFVYGTFPLSFTHVISQILGMSDYMGVLLVGRAISAILDTLIAIGVYLLAKQLFGAKSVQAPIWAVLAYTLTVFAIQQAHFFTVDIFATAGMFWAIIVALWYVHKPRLHLAFLTSLFIALGIASKITSILLVPLISIFFLIAVCSHKKRKREIGLHAILSSLLVIIVVRIANPYYFAHLSWLDWTVNPSFQSSLAQLQLLSTSDAAFPPAVQWITKPPILFPLQQIIMAGCGVVLSCLFVWGVLSIVMYESWSKKSANFGAECSSLLGLFFFYLLWHTVCQDHALPIRLVSTHGHRCRIWGCSMGTSKMEKGVIMWPSLYLAWCFSLYLHGASFTRSGITVDCREYPCWSEGEL